VAGWLEKDELPQFLKRPGNALPDSRKSTQRRISGATLNVAGGQTVVNDCADELDSYNQNNAALDEQQNVVETKEGGAGDWNKRVLAAVGAKYGTDSSEYEMVGGTRTSERKKPKAKGPGGGTAPPKP
jgi:hypothetical protein